jgi:hypothetical protein
VYRMRGATGVQVDRMRRRCTGTVGEGKGSAWGALRKKKMNGKVEGGQ